MSARREARGTRENASGHTELTYFPQIVRFMAASHQLPSCESDARKQGILVSALRARAWLMSVSSSSCPCVLADEVRPRAMQIIRTDAPPTGPRSSEKFEPGGGAEPGSLGLPPGGGAVGSTSNVTAPPGGGSPGSMAGPSSSSVSAKKLSHISAAESLSRSSCENRGLPLCSP